MDSSNTTMEPLPVFENAAEGLAHLDEIVRFHEEAQARMDQLATDPRQQSYFMRMDRRTVIKNEDEYRHCQEQHVPMKIIPYGHAIQTLKEEDARERQAKRKRQKQKAAKKSRKQNR